MQESGKDVMLKRIQVIVAILAGLATLSFGLYNCKKAFFPEKAISAISVRVLSEETRLPIAGASIHLSNANNALLVTGYSDLSGSFSQEAIASGAGILKVGAKDYEPEILTLTLETGKNMSFDVFLRPIPRPKVVEPVMIAPQQPIAPSKSSAIQSALDEVGSSWIKKLAAKAEAKQEPASETSQ